MKKLVRCRLCGLVIEESKLHDVCPACGMSRKMFEDYTDPLEANRRFFLSLDIHPVVVHAPQALAFLMLLLALFTVAFPDLFALQLRNTLNVMGVILPVVLLGSFATGIFDAIMRFRKVNTPMLVSKMIWGGLFFASSLAMAWALLLAGFSGMTALLTYFAANTLAFVCSIFLGLIGSKLVTSLFVKLAPKSGASTEK